MQKATNTPPLYERIQKLQMQLLTTDIFAKGSLCDEFLALIGEVDENKPEGKAELMSFIIPHLIDLGRNDDVLKMVDYLLSQKNYRFHLNAIFARSEMAKRANDWNLYVKIFEEGIAIAEKNNDSVALSEGYVLRAKGLMMLEKHSEALDDLNRCIPIAESVHNYNLVAVAKYYIGVALWSIDCDNLAMEKFREASDLACEQKSSDIIRHTEAARALFLLKKGEAKAAEGVLEAWYEQFGRML